MKSFSISKDKNRFSSVFVRYFVLILTLVFVLLFLFSLYISYTASRNFQTQQKLSEQGILRQATERIDNTLYLVNRLAASTSENPDIITSAIVPSLDNPQRSFALVSALVSLVEENVFIDKAYLYERTKGYVFSSDSLITTLSGMMDSAIISNCLYNPSYILLHNENNRSMARLVQDGQKLYFIYDFIYTNDGPLSTLILDINKKELFSGFLSIPSLDQYDITVYGDHTTPIYLTSGADQEILTGKAASLSFSSDYTSWKYSLYPRNRRTLSWLSNLRQLLPFLGVLLLVSLLLTYFITRRAYSPIARLTNIVGGQAKSESAGNVRGSEFVFLEGAYQKLMLDNEAASTIIQTARPELEEKMFSDLLAGKELPEDELTAQLSRLESQFHVHDKYQVLLFSLQDTSSMDPLSVRICLLHLQQAIAKLFRDEWGCYQLLGDTDERFRMIICYPENVSMAQIKRILRSFTTTLDEMLKDSSISFLYASGTVSASILDLPVSSEKAQEKLRLLLYYGEDTAASASGGSQDTISDEYFSSLLSQISEKLAEGDLPLAQTGLSRLLEELFDGHRELPVQRSVCEKLMNVLIERILPYQLEDEKEGRSASYNGIYEKIRTAPNSQALAEIAAAETASLMDTLRSESRRSQKRIIARARDFITSNYSNADLSIQDIAAYAGCSASYLSAVFSEYTGESLVTCLNNYRITVACDLLANSQILIRDVGLKAGFNTVQNFNRVFKKNTGMTPNEYRKNMS